MMRMISQRLRQELPGLRGFSETNLKNMRSFYEAWNSIEVNSSVTTDEFGKVPISTLPKQGYPFTNSGETHSLCWNITDSIREEKDEEKKNITDKETGGQTSGQRRTTSSEMNVASSEKSSV